MSMTLNDFLEANLQQKVPFIHPRNIPQRFKDEVGCFEHNGSFVTDDVYQFARKSVIQILGQPMVPDPDPRPFWDKIKSDTKLRRFFKDNGYMDRPAYFIQTIQDDLNSPCHAFILFGQEAQIQCL